MCGRRRGDYISGFCGTGFAGGSAVDNVFAWLDELIQRRAGAEAVRPTWIFYNPSDPPSPATQEFIAVL
jgi:hypothetical protein